MSNTVQNGKGDKPRNNFSEDFQRNYDRIFRKRPVKNFQKASKEQARTPRKALGDLIVMAPRIPILPAFNAWGGI